MDREDRIRQRAYRIWEDEGCPDGHDREHWDRAEREVDDKPAEAPSSDATGAENPATNTGSPEPISERTARPAGSRGSDGRRTAGAAAGGSVPK
jgi:DUF2934 family protein